MSRKLVLSVFLVAILLSGKAFAFNVQEATDEYIKQTKTCLGIIPVYREVIQAYNKKFLNGAVFKNSKDFMLLQDIKFDVFKAEQLCSLLLFQLIKFKKNKKFPEAVRFPGFTKIPNNPKNKIPSLAAAYYLSELYSFDFLLMTSVNLTDDHQKWFDKEFKNSLSVETNRIRTLKKEVDAKFHRLQSAVTDLKLLEKFQNPLKK